MKRRILLLLLSGAMLSPLLLSHAQTQRGQTVRIRVENGQVLDLYDESHALVIGVSEYNRGWRRLPGVRADVGEVARVLESQGFKTVTKLFDPGRKEFDDAIRQFIGRYGLRERNRLVIYFAGHGHTERLSDDRDLGYVVMRDAPLPDRDPENFFLASVSMDEINSHALRIKSKHALFVFDSCFSGTIFRGESERRTPPAIASLTAGPVRQFITSGSAGQSVPDDSIFRRYFVRAFDKAEGDLNGDGFITGEELGKYLMGTVADDSRDTQTPRHGKIKDAKLSIGDLVFALPRRASPTPTPTPTPSFDPASLELELWRSADRANEISEFEEYLRQYPQGRYAVSARNRIARLRAPATVAPPVTPPASTRMSVAGVPLSALAPFITVKVDAGGKIIERRANQESWGYVEDLGNGVKLEMVEISPGEFQMGSDEYSDEKPIHKVRVSGFLMGKFEVTQEQWAVVARLPKVKIDLNADPSRFKGAKLPVENVSWEDAQEFCARLSRKTGGNYRLPSEAEWEYAARAGTTTPFAFGPTVNPEIVNYDGNYPYGSAAKGLYRQKTVDAGSLGAANGWGLFDMHGNVWEWCEDDYHDSYNGAPTDGSARRAADISARAPLRVIRGGSWLNNAVYCRSAYRYRNSPGRRLDFVGFRLVRTYR